MLTCWDLGQSPWYHEYDDRCHDDDHDEDYRYEDDHDANDDIQCWPAESWDRAPDIMIMMITLMMLIMMMIIA